MTVSNPRRKHPLRRLLIGYVIFVALIWFMRIIGATWGVYGLFFTGFPYLIASNLVVAIIAILIRAKRTAILAILVTLLGAIWIVPRLLPPVSIPEPQGTVVKLLTFNIYPYNSRAEEALQWVLEQDADIVALQEVHVSTANLEAAYPYHEILPEFRTLRIFSRYPITASAVIELDKPQQRVLLDIDGRSVALYNVQLWMPLNERDGDFILFRYDESRRNRQIHDLIRLGGIEPQPVIIAGDFNLSEWSLAYDELAQTFNDSYRHSSWGLGVTFPAGESEDLPHIMPPLVRIDYVWTSNLIRPLSAMVGVPLGSDHLPVVVTLDVR